MIISISKSLSKIILGDLCTSMCPNTTSLRYKRGRISKHKLTVNSRRIQQRLLVFKLYNYFAQSLVRYFVGLISTRATALDFLRGIHINNEHCSRSEIVLTLLQRGSDYSTYSGTTSRRIPIDPKNISEVHSAPTSKSSRTPLDVVFCIRCSDTEPLAGMLR